VLGFFGRPITHSNSIQFRSGSSGVVTDECEPINVVVVLIVFASLDLWKSHFRRSNFTSCEDIIHGRGQKHFSQPYVIRSDLRLGSRSNVETLRLDPWDPCSFCIPGTRAYFEFRRADSITLLPHGSHFHHMTVLRLHELSTLT